MTRDAPVRSVSILGTPYRIEYRKFEDDVSFAKQKCDGYCESSNHLIVCCELSTHPNMQDETPDCIENIEKLTLRHKIIHAFLAESGLRESSGVYGTGWAVNEEMVDWMAIQFPKIKSVYEQLNIL